MRAPVLVALRRIPRQYPPEQAPEVDAAILDAWDRRLLAHCRDAAPWLPAFKAAAQRRKALDGLLAAITAGDKPTIAAVTNPS